MDLLLGRESLWQLKVLGFNLEVGKIYKWVRTIEKGIEIIIVNFTQFEKVLACFWTRLYLQVYDDVSQRRF